MKKNTRNIKKARVIGAVLAAAFVVSASAAFSAVSASAAEVDSQTQYGSCIVYSNEASIVSPVGNVCVLPWERIIVPHPVV